MQNEFKSGSRHGVAGEMVKIGKWQAEWKNPA